MRTKGWIRKILRHHPLLPRALPSPRPRLCPPRCVYNQDYTERIIMIDPVERESKARKLHHQRCEESLPSPRSLPSPQKYVYNQYLIFISNCTPTWECVITKDPKKRYKKAWKLCHPEHRACLFQGMIPDISFFLSWMIHQPRVYGSSRAFLKGVEDWTPRVLRPYSP